MPEDFYEQADAASILIDSGFQCCDAWQPSRRDAQPCRTRRPDQLAEQVHVAR
jgi:exo-1,4-beta-D-glucosaminidase